MIIYAKNKKAHFDYEILEKYEAGIKLLGFEVKSVRNGRMSLKGAFVIIRGGEIFLINADIPPYQPSNTDSQYDPLRARKLLLSKKEITRLATSTKNKSLTIIPILVYAKGRKIKIEIALVRGKKKYDKREQIKKKETERHIRKTIGS